MVCGAGPWETGGGISPISRDGQLVNGFGVRSGTPSVLVGVEELRAGLMEGKGGTVGDGDRIGVASQSIRLKTMVNYAWM